MLYVVVGSQDDPTTTATDELLTATQVTARARGARRDDGCGIETRDL